MSCAHPECLDDARMPRAWRLALLARCTGGLCACRAPRATDSGAPPSPALPREAFAGPGEMSHAAAGPVAYVPEGTQLGMPLPYAPAGPWAPPGLRQPWPEDEYLADGGDRNLAVEVAPDWHVAGLDPEDTVVHFDTLDGATIVEPSNPVHIYAPRFAAIRKVDTLVLNQGDVGPGDVRQPTRLVRYDDVQEAATSTQNLQPGRHLAAAPPVIYRGRQGNGAASSALGPRGFQDAFLPYENLQAIRHGQLDERESARLAQGVAAAIAWTHAHAVQVILDAQSATEEVGTQYSHMVYGLAEAPANPRLRVIKVASTQFAEPGDVVDFTIRFDNVGNQEIGNVTILDSLTTRLEYVPKSAQCSLDADFSTAPNEAGSQTLRWEIRDPLPTGQGGLVRFRCRVR